MIQNQKINNSLVLLAILICSQSIPGYAKITLAPGSWADRSYIDNNKHNPNAYLNFEYEGCESSPSPDKIQLKADGCRAEKKPINSDLPADRIGLITASYDGGSKECTTKTKKQLSGSHNLKSIYKKFEDSGCNPSHIVIRDNSNYKKANKIKIKKSDRDLCTPPPVRIGKSGFPTDKISLLKLSATVDSLMLGNHTEFVYDHDNNDWCIYYDPAGSPKRKSPNDPHRKKNCGAYPSPIPIMHQNGKNLVVTGTIELGANGKANVRATQKRSYPSRAAVTAAQARGDFSRSIDKNKGHFQFHSWRSKHHKVRRSIVRAYDGQNKHLRSLNIFNRNLFGRRSTKNWCENEHCFLGVKNTTLAKNNCTSSPSLNMDNGGSGNVCSSCVGVTPGLCATGQKETDALKKLLGEDDSFQLQGTGEYKPNKNVYSSLLKRFGLMKRSTSATEANWGCRPGHAPENLETFNPPIGGDDIESAPNRTVNSEKI